MQVRLRPLFVSFLLLLGPASAARAQAVLVNGIATLVRLGATAAYGKYGDKSVTTGTYQGKEFAMKRTPADKLSGKAADNIRLLEAQLDQCHAQLADGAAAVCPADRLALIKSTQAIVAETRPNWNQKYYKEELDFYLAEDARRQQAAPQPAPTGGGAAK